MSRIEYIEVEMYRKMRDSLGLDPVEDRPAAVSKDGWRDMPDAQFLQDQVFIRVPSLHAGDHHTPGVQLAGHFCRESLVAPAKQQGKHLGMGVRNDRKSVVSGKSVEVRVALGGRRIIKKK